MRLLHLLSFISVAVSSAAASAVSPRAATYTNPVFWEDLADLDIRRVNNTYYYSASTMHYSPGAPILRSYDLVNWEFIGHSVPALEFGDDGDYNLTTGRAYVRGIWASTLNYRASNNLWYWMGCVDFAKTYIYTAPSVTGPWTQVSILSTCFYDCGLLIDDDDTMYVSYGGTTINVAQLSSDGLSMVSTHAVYTNSTIGAIEGSRFYKRNGMYYIVTDHPATAEYVLKASSPFGPYTANTLVNTIDFPVTGTDNPHQGGLVETPAGDWYYMAFTDAYPGGRLPVLAPITWDSAGWPHVTTVNGDWGLSYPYPTTEVTVSSPTGTDTFAGTSLGPQWEWNHNPDPTKFTVNNGLTLRTATLTAASDLYAARNTLTHRILGPISTATIALDYSGMVNGDRAGLALLRDISGWIGVSHDSGAARVEVVTGITMNTDWTTNTTGTIQASTPISGGKIWLRATANVGNGGDSATFQYSTDGATFHALGGALALNTNWTFFMGYRFGIFNYAMQALGGKVVVSSFTMEAGAGTSGGTGTTTTTGAGSGSTGTGTGAGGTVAQYGQCGGTGWTGATKCVSPFTCTVENAYYSQCL
ncbi:putative xylosidase/glycosyl hydrolase [Mycena epipterygia]|nr:putative xylosidase/glycosyl hydrolase [Mycena epipterygia]